MSEPPAPGQQQERQSRRGEEASDAPQEILRRGEHALASGDLDETGRCLDRLEHLAPDLPGLNRLRSNLRGAWRQARLEAKIETTEKMLTRYVKEGKKGLAELALESLLELDASHARRGEWERWVAALGEELEEQRRLDEDLKAGLRALQADDLRGAKSHLESLRRQSSSSRAAAELAAEVAAFEAGLAQDADIERRKRTLETLLAERRLDEAERELDRLAALEVPKVTLDFLRKRLADARTHRRAQSLLTELEKRFQMHLDAGNWEGARDIAHLVGERFAESGRASTMLAEAQAQENQYRREQSIEEGFAALERYISEGKRLEAELALRVLEGLQVDRRLLALFEDRVKAL